MLQQLWAIREEVTQRKPLIYNITNNVVTNFTANVLLAVGASPIMSEGELEAEELAKIADAVILNIGTLHPRQVDYFLKAGELANKYSKQVILDPVGVGATTYRNETALQIISQTKLSLIRGNCGEIGFLTGTVSQNKGVDSSHTEIDSELTKSLASKTGALVCATGCTDYLSNGVQVGSNQTGHELLQLVTGTGCALTSVMGAFLAVSPDPLLGGLAGLAFYGAAAEKAAGARKDVEKASGGKAAIGKADVEDIGFVQGPGSFAVKFLDALYNLSYAEFTQFAEGKVKIME